MKIKYSLVALVALSNISFVNAQSLENAIKNVETSGTVAYRYNDYEESTSDANKDKSLGSDSTNLYKVAINLKSKVNDDVVFNSRFIAGNRANAGEVGLHTQTTGDSNVDVFLSEANFAYSGLKNTIVTVGKQGIVTPFTIARDSIGNEATGTGLVATTHYLDMLSLTAGYYNQTNFNNNDGGLDDPTGAEDLYYVTANLAIANTTIDATYADLQEKFDAYSVGINAEYAIDQLKLNPYARYSSLDLDSTSDKNSLWKTGIDAGFGIFGAYLAYGETHKDGGTVGVDASSDSGMDDHWRVTLSGISDASVVYASVNAQVTEKINLALKYSQLDAGADSNATDQNEIYVQTAYKMSNNLSTYVRLGQFEVNEFYSDNSDLKSNIGRVHVQYSF